MLAQTDEQARPASCAGLVVDDDELMRESVSATLSDLGVEVHQAADGLEGLEVLESHPEIAVVVTDIAMPRLDGVSFIQRARARHPGLKVLFDLWVLHAILYNKIFIIVVETMQRDF